MALVLKGVSLWFTFPYVVLLVAAMMFAKMVIPTANNAIFAAIPNAHAKLFMPTIPGCKPDVKKSILQWSVDGAGIRAISRCLGVSSVTVLSE